MMKFSKYHGCGNDFIIVDYKEFIDYSALAIKLCNRKISVGADGLIVVKTNPLEMKFFNSDGSVAPMCGNGIRCFAKYVCDEGIVLDKYFDVLTLAGVMKIEVFDDDDFLVNVNMGKPIFSNDSIKASDDLSFINREIKLRDKKIVINSLFMATIHTVIFVDDFNELSLYAEDICNFSLFKEKTNVNFVKVLDKDNFIIKTFERGVGWTSACGSGVCASYVIGRKLGLCNNVLKGHLEYGYLLITEIDDSIFMKGPAVKVFQSEMEEVI